MAQSRRLPDLLKRFQDGAIYWWQLGRDRKGRQSSSTGFGRLSANPLYVRSRRLNRVGVPLNLIVFPMRDMLDTLIYESLLLQMDINVVWVCGVEFSLCSRFG